jgi:hypothetical protein
MANSCSIMLNVEIIMLSFLAGIYPILTALYQIVALIISNPINSIYPLK